MKGLGVDTVAISKFNEVLAKSGDSFVEHVFTSNERAYCQAAANPNQSFAARFAAKEALLKAIPSLRSYGVDWQDMEITHNGFGAPEFVIAGRLRDNMERTGIERIMLSISHTSESAVAVAIVL